MQTNLDTATKLRLEQYIAEMRKICTLLGGTWLLEYHQEALGICRFFAKYLANALMKGDFNLADKIAALPSLLDKVQEEYNVRDKMQTTLGESIALTKHGLELINAIRTCTQVMKFSALTATLRNFIEQAQSSLDNIKYMKLLETASTFPNQDTAATPENYARLVNEFNQYYRQEYIRQYMLLERNEVVTRLRAELLPGLILNSGADTALSFINEQISEEQCNQFIPQWGAAINVLIWEPARFKFELTKEDNINADNQSLEVPHYISICFNYYKSLPTLFICNANFGVVAYTDIEKFKKSLAKMLYSHVSLSEIKEPHCFNEPMQHEGYQLQEIITSDNWLRRFCAPGQNDSLPTATLAGQITMPPWAKIVLSHLKNYENPSMNAWQKVQFLIKIKDWLLNDKIVAQYKSNPPQEKMVTELLAQIERYFTPSSKVQLDGAHTMVQDSLRSTLSYAQVGI